MPQNTVYSNIDETKTNIKLTSKQWKKEMDRPVHYYNQIAKCMHDLHLGDSKVRSKSIEKD